MDTAAARRTDGDESGIPDAVRKAEDAVAALAESFLEWIGADISRARTALEAAGATAGDNRDDLRTIFEVMHNVKGQGGSFGYGLLTDIAGSLCDYMRQGEGTADEKQLKVVTAHFIALDFVLEKNIQGDGGD
ncbi:MAG: Hpt domain-containing protein, partial [Alphaproteobacteria bacterium]